MVSKDLIIGVDEAGRGPLAGPVIVAAVMASHQALKNLPLDRDSKKLSASSREEWYKKIEIAEKVGDLFFSFTLVSEKIIDKIGIVGAISRALETSLSKLPINPDHHKIFLDGSLRAPIHYKKQKTIIGGDARVPVIGLASVVAKVTRDERMKKLSKKYPEYGFADHKGYATIDHYLALLEHGPCPIHRQSYLSFLSD